MVYEIPVERARKDAAPRAGTPSAPEGGESPAGSEAAGGAPETSIRSENNFGTSSDVPGAPPGGRDGSGGGGASPPGDGGSGGTVDRIAGATAGSAGPGSEGPSEGVVYPLLAALVAVGAGIGLFAGHRTLRGRRG